MHTSKLKEWYMSEKYHLVEQKNVFFWGSGICRFYLVALDMSLIDRIVILAETSLQAMWPCVWSMMMGGQKYFFAYNLRDGLKPFEHSLPIHPILS